ncbi:oleate hydratase [Stenotrophomonas koreensis]|uniref:oleate hydratase n=1 Tax=Stenotrophomonas koreensis TaxID=266128 RepID=UPI0033957A6A
MNTPGKPAFQHEPDATAGYWHNSAANTLPPPDMIGNYQRFKPLPPPGVEQRKAWIVGSGIAGLAAAFYLIRDGHMPGKNITLIDALDIEGGSLDGSGNPEDGYLVRGGREMNWHYENLWDMFQDVPALELPEGFSVLDEYRLANDSDSNWSKSRLMHQQGKVVADFARFGLTRKQQWEIVSLLLKRKDELDDLTIQDHFSEGFLQTHFWFLFRTMFAFENWQSLLEMKLYLHRFLDSVDGFGDLSALVFPKYNQYDTFVTPLIRHLRAQGVQLQLGTQVPDLEFSTHGDIRTVTALHTRGKDGEGRIDVGPQDLVIALTGSMTEDTAYGDMDTVPPLVRHEGGPPPESGWTLWRNLARHSPVFGKPEKFCGDIDRSMWESATLTCQPSPLVDKLRELSVNEPTSGKTATGGIITFIDSNWVLSVTINRQPHFPGQPKDTVVMWVYGLLMDQPGNLVKKTMPECTGREILAELCHHLGIGDQLDAIVAQTKVRLALMPYITAQFMPRAKGDRPHVVPPGCTNLALVGQFVETANDVVFTMDSSIRTARVAVYTLLDLPKQVPDLSPTQYDIRSLFRGARALNNGEPFPGERMLHKLLDNTYYAHILPPLPASEGTATRRERLEAELGKLREKSGWALQGLAQWIDRFGDQLRGKDRD